MNIEKILNRMNTEILDSDLNDFIQNNINFIGLDITRFSKILLAQLYVFNEYLNFDITNIINEIKYLEGIKDTTSTKREAQFNRKPLKGIWHKHFFDARYILKNIGSEFGLDYKGNRKLNKLLFKNEMHENIINELTVDTFIKRSKEKRLTGEWIVFIKVNDTNHYLTISRHDEDDTELYKRIQNIDDFK